MGGVGLFVLGIIIGIVIVGTGVLIATEIEKRWKWIPTLSGFVVYIAKHNIEVNPVYEKYGLKRCGCLMCCMASPKDRQKEAKLFPKYAENLRRLCEKIAKNRTKDISGGELYEIYLR